MSRETQEEWRPVVGWEGLYEVSSWGNVRSLPRKVASRGRVGFKQVPGITMKQKRNAKGYMAICFRDAHNGRCKDVSVHRLVVEAFIGTISDGYCPNHKNGVRHDNRLTNLELCTNSENHLHRCRVLGRGRGETHNLAILTEDQVVSIRAEYAVRTRTYGATITIARKYGVSANVIGAVVHRRNWKHIS